VHAYFKEKCVAEYYKNLNHNKKITENCFLTFEIFYGSEELYNEARNY